MKLRVVVLGAGFGGLEVTSLLSEALGELLDLTLIDQNDTFFFGYSKLDVMFGRLEPAAVRFGYRHIAKPGVRFLQERITHIDPEKRRVRTDQGKYDADVLVVALGADYDQHATPGLSEGGHEFYSFAGAERVRAALPKFTKGRVVIGVADTPYKCPQAPSEAALLLHEYLTAAGMRSACEIVFVCPFEQPIPPSPETSQALLAAFAERGITYVPNRLVKALDPARQTAILHDQSEISYDLFLGVPRHCAPQVVRRSDLNTFGWVQVDPSTLRTRSENVYAIGDVTEVGAPKAGAFAESAARVVAAQILAGYHGGESPADYRGEGACYVEFGGGYAGRLDLAFLVGPPKGKFHWPSASLAEEKQQLEVQRRARWFGDIPGGG